MNTFYEHHKNSIKFSYRCFDRILLNGLIQPFQQPERVIGFFNAYRDGERVTRNRLRDIAQQFQNWVKNRAEKWGSPILEAPAGRRDDFVDPYFKGAKTDQVVVILKAREPARIMTAIGAERSLASAVRSALDRAVQLLPQRPTLGSHVRANLPLSAFFSPCVP
jgi:hypothetical protein